MLSTKLQPALELRPSITSPGTLERGGYQLWPENQVSSLPFQGDEKNVINVIGISSLWL